MVNEEEPPRPEEMPEIPRGKVRACLFIPPVLSLVFGVLTGSGALPMTIVAIILGATFFAEAMRLRYRGRSLGLLAAGYVVGELVACALVYLPFIWAAGLI